MNCVFFGGLNLEEVAEVLRVSVSSVRRDWRMAQGLVTSAIKSNDMTPERYKIVGRLFDEAESYKKAVEFGNTSTGTQIYLGAAYAHAEEREKALEILRVLRSSKEYVSPGELPVLLGALGRKDEAFAPFEKAFAVRDLQLATITGDPAFDPLRNDPRFAALVRRVGFPR